MKEVLVFDLDDTLYPEHQYVKSGFRAVGEWLEEELGLSGFQALAVDLFENGERGNIFNQVLAALHIPCTQDLIDQLISVYRSHEPAIRLYDDAAWALRKYENHSLGLITDGYLESQQNKVAALGLEEKFETIVFSDELGRENWKPSRVPYERVMAVIGEKGKRFTYIGDNPTKDFVTARLLGWRTIMISREQGEYSSAEIAEGYEADFSITQLYELEQILCC